MCVWCVSLHQQKSPDKHLLLLLLLCEAKLIAPKHVRVVCLVFVYVFHQLCS